MIKKQPLCGFRQKFVNAMASPANDQRAEWIALREVVGSEITMYRS
jgi:hypothetical protein